MKNTKSIGDLSEIMVLAALVKAGKVVLKPFGDNQRYDLAIDEDGKLIRVQCKTGQIDQDGDSFAFPTCSSYEHRGRKSKSYKGEIEFFGVYVPGIDKVYMVPVELVGEREATLRLKPTKNGQSKNIRWAKDFELS